MSGPVRITGLRELRRDLKRLEPEGAWKATLKDAGMQAGEVVAGDARSRAARGATTLAGTGASMGHEAIASIRVLAQQTRVYVAGGSARIAWFAGWNFGSGGGHRQFPAKRSPDYTLYSAIEDNQADFVEAYKDGIDKLMEQYGFK